MFYPFYKRLTRHLAHFVLQFIIKLYQLLQQVILYISTNN